MRSGILIISIVVALCACAASAEQPAQVSPGDILIMSSGDPNETVPAVGADPNKTWDPAEHFTADWEYISVNMTSRLYNPAVEPGVQQPGSEWSLSLAAFVDIIDSNGLIGWSPFETSVMAYDQDGNLVAGSTPRTPLVRWYQPPWSLQLPSELVGRFHPNRFTLSLPMDANAVYPAILARVEWSTNVLVSEDIKTVDIPFEPNDTWVEIVPGLEVLVQDATVDQGKYQYTIQVRYDSVQVDYLSGGVVHVWPDEALPPAAVLNMVVVNADGTPVHDLGGGSFSTSGEYTGSNAQITGTVKGSGSCEACGTAAGFRYTFAFNMYELEVPFVLENVPVPTF